jgi:Predicted 3'-5' exonuclease related to the exonuclease domain of PolB
MPVWASMLRPAGNDPENVRVSPAAGATKWLETSSEKALPSKVERFADRLAMGIGRRHGNCVVAEIAVGRHAEDHAGRGIDAEAGRHRSGEGQGVTGRILSSFSYGAKVKLDELSRIMGLPGKPDGIDGSQVEAYFNAGRIQEIADYCKSDVINTYWLWLRHELFRGRLDQNQFESSERDVTRVVGSAADRAAR